MMRKLALLLFLLWLGSNRPLHSQDDPGQVFSEAYGHFSRGSFSQAGDLFLKTLDQNFILEDHSLYFIGFSAFSTGENEKARDFLTRLRKKFPQSIWSSSAGLTLAKIAMAEGDGSQAVRMLRELRSKNTSKEIAEEALFLLADTHRRQGEIRSAFSLFQELRTTAPLSRWANAARKEVASMREEQPQLLNLSTPEAVSKEGELLLKERQYAEAERLFRDAQDSISMENPLRPRLLMGLANVYRGARNPEKGMAVLNEILRDHPQSPEAPEALYRLGRTLWNRDQNLEALKRFEELKERYPKRSFVDFADFASARIYDSSGNPEEAIRIYQEFPRRHPESNLRAEAAWSLAWIHYLQGDFRKAEQAFKDMASSPGVGRYQTAALYWQARAAEKSGNLEEAKPVYRKLGTSQDVSFYSGLAQKRLEKLGHPIEKKATVPASPDPLPRRNADGSFHLPRAQKLAEISLSGLARSELDAIKAEEEDLHLKLILAREYARNGVFDRSVFLANQIPGFHEDLTRHRFPLAYWDLIQKKSQQNGLDPYLIVALIRQESLFNPAALSSASALGLMQLLPSTASRTAARMGLQRPEPKDLLDPELNLTLGIAYLKELLVRYSNSLPKAIAAYNAGENAVDRWEKQLKTEDEDEFIERIPYGETRLYVKLVLRNHLTYRTIYDSGR